MIIVIDGPAGSGKSSTAKAVAQSLEIQYLDSGALYRSLTFHFLELHKNHEMFIESLNDLKLTFKYEERLFRVWLNDEEITSKIRSMLVSSHVSEVASNPVVRAYVNRLMKKSIEKDIYIAEGRDLGTAVFPEASLKFFMTASVEKRAERRFKELQEKGTEATLEEIEENIRQRDEVDSKRKADPLKQADSAKLIDTTELTFEEQVEKISSEIKKVVQINH